MVCNKRMSCGKHTCLQVCCPEREQGSLSASHLCTTACGKPLGCGHHTCADFCHTGPCRPCAVTLWDGVACSCGGTRVPGPVRCGTPAPTCSRPCNVPRACGHKCAYTCHENACPPCVILLSTPCAGGHVTLPHVQCHIARGLNGAPSCGKPCGHHRMECGGAHVCTRKCHAGPCSLIAAASSSSTATTSMTATTVVAAAAAASAMTTVHQKGNSGATASSLATRPASVTTAPAPASAMWSKLVSAGLLSLSSSGLRVFSSWSNSLHVPSCMISLPSWLYLDAPSSPFFLFSCLFSLHL